MRLHPNEAKKSGSDFWSLPESLPDFIRLEPPFLARAVFVSGLDKGVAQNVQNGLQRFPAPILFVVVELATLIHKTVNLLDCTGEFLLVLLRGVAVQALDVKSHTLILGTLAVPVVDRLDVHFQQLVAEPVQLLQSARVIRLIHFAKLDDALDARHPVFVHGAQNVLETLFPTNESAH